ncbi:MAG: hypothetical protein D6679_10420 [Candidatus Hydrogenedentota bacterium]|nr:MAG: hypothetical protein D6679_10420 [Candidatus Hydrogenedentota bacterium]
MARFLLEALVLAERGFLSGTRLSPSPASLSAAGNVSIPILSRLITRPASPGSTAGLRAPPRAGESGLHGGTRTGRGFSNRRRPDGAFPNWRGGEKGALPRRFVFVLPFFRAFR